MGLELGDGTGRIIGAAIEVHRTLGPGFLESVYENALVDDEIVVELKALRRLEDIHFVIVRSYLKAVRREHALLLNFAGPTLEIKRVSTRLQDEACSVSWVPGFPRLKSGRIRP